MLVVAGTVFFAFVVMRDVWILSCWSGRPPLDALLENDAE